MVGKVAKVKRPVSPWSKRSSGLRKPAAATWIHPAEYCVEREERAVSPRPTATTPDPPSAVSSVETLADRAEIRIRGDYFGERPSGTDAAMGQ